MKLVIKAGAAAPNVICSRKCKNDIHRVKTSVAVVEGGRDRAGKVNLIYTTHAQFM